MQLALPGQFALEPGFEEALWHTAIPPGEPPPIGSTKGLEELTIQSPNAESKATDPQTESPLNAAVMAMVGSSIVPPAAPVVLAEPIKPAIEVTKVVNPAVLLQKQPSESVGEVPAEDFDIEVKPADIGTEVKVTVALRRPETTATEILQAKPAENVAVEQNTAIPTQDSSPQPDSDSGEGEGEGEGEVPNKREESPKHGPTAEAKPSHVNQRSQDFRAEAAPMRPANVREVILEHLEAVAIRQNPSVTVEFESPQGMSTVDVSHENGQIRMHFVTENQTVRAALESSKSDLDRSLRDAGYQGSQMSFDTARQNQSEGQKSKSFFNLTHVSDESNGAQARRSLWGLEILA